MLIHAEEAHLLRPALEWFVADLQRMGASKKLERIGPIVVRCRWLANWYAAHLRDISADENAANRGETPAPSQHDDWITTDDAGAMLAVTPTRVCQPLRLRELDGRKVGRVRLVSAASVRAYQGRAA